MSDQKSILIVGIGNPYRCDDGIGPLIAKHLGNMIPEKVDVLSDIKDGLSLMDLWEKYDCVYLIDAVKSGGAPGRMYRFDASTEDLPHNFFTNYSTHSINIPEIIALAGNLNLLPEELIIYGVEGKDFRMGKELSEEVRLSISSVAGCIKNELEKRELSSA